MLKIRNISGGKKCLFFRKFWVSTKGMILNKYIEYKSELKQAYHNYDLIKLQSMMVFTHNYCRSISLTKVSV